MDVLNNNGNGGRTVLPTTVTEWPRQGFEQYSALPAIHYRGQFLSYRQLDMLSNRIANYLADRGVKKGDRVGMSLERSVEMVACMLGIFKSGATFVPLDPNYPGERIEMMREDVNLNFMIAHQHLADRFDGMGDHLMVWNETEDEIETYPDTHPLIALAAEDVAYIVFTSGSTGRPKGIAMPHRCLSNVVEVQLERKYFKKGARLLQYSSISFDVSFQGILTTLATGGTIYLIGDSERRDPRILLRKLQKFKIERLFLPYVAFRSLVEVAVATDSYPINLKEVITAGEQLRVDGAVRAFFAHLPGAILDNQYGASETRMVSAHLLEGDPAQWADLPSVGSPLKNSSVYILDKNLQPVEDGEVGELYLSGRNIAHGYIGRDDLTKKSFIKNPFDDKHGPLLYKSGDLGVYNNDGSIELLGRSDHQIKIRGHRVEPGEVNNNGAEFTGIAQCFTHSFTDPKGNTQLVMYYNSKRDTVVDKKEFRSYLAQSLPDYMVPAFIIEIDKIPYTPSGKVDLKALPTPQNKMRDFEKEEIAYQSDTEARLAQIWEGLLGFKGTPRTANFFDIGGDSLNAVTLFMEIEEQFHKYLPLSTLAQAPTIEALAAIITAEHTELDQSKFRSLQVLQRGNTSHAPLSLIHGGGGNVLMFKDLAHALPSEQPVFAFQWPGWDGYQGEEDIMAMARAYKNELRRACPNGPYRLGGHCIGGGIAIEMARLLKAEGAEVLDPLLITDAANFYSNYYHSNEPESSEESKKAFKQAKQRLDSRISKYMVSHGEQPQNEAGKVVVDANDYSAKRYPTLAKMLPFYGPLAAVTLKMQHRLQLLNIFTRKNLALKIPVKYRELYCSTSLLKATKKYRKSVYDGDILYFKSEVFRGRILGRRGWWEDSFFGFEELCAGRFEGHVVGGEHSDMLKRESVQNIIKQQMFSTDD